MLDALTYQNMVKKINSNIERYGIENDTIGILVTRPDLLTGRNILASLGYYHFRTGKTVNFYLPGYGAYWNDSYPDGEVVTMIEGIKWSFSNEMFVYFVEELEKYSKWNYSGESELLLVNLKDGLLTYDGMMQFKLDSMLRDGVIPSVNHFFEQLFNLCKEKETLNQISNAFGVDKAKQVTIEGLLNKLPIGLGNVFAQEKYFCIRNMSK